MEKVLLKTDEYSGKYVAFISAEDNTVVGSGTTAEEAYREADKKGYASPILFYVPEKHSVHIY